MKVVQPSGIELVDRETSIWVRVHWHNDAFAGQTLDTPFIFKSPPAKKASASAPVKPKPKPAAPKPAIPSEPEVTPAVRVQ